MDELGGESDGHWAGGSEVKKTTHAIALRSSVNRYAGTITMLPSVFSPKEEKEPEPNWSPYKSTGLRSGGHLKRPRQEARKDDGPGFLTAVAEMPKLVLNAASNAVVRAGLHPYKGGLDDEVRECVGGGVGRGGVGGGRG